MLIFYRCKGLVKAKEKRKKSAKRKNPHNTTPPPPVWTVYPGQDEFMESCCRCQILILPSVCLSKNIDLSDQVTFLQSFIQLWWVCAHCTLGFLFKQNLTWCYDVLSIQLNNQAVHYLSYCSLSASQCEHSALSSLKKTFSSADLPITGCFYTILSKL